MEKNTDRENIPEKSDAEYYTKLFHDLRTCLSIMGGYTSMLLEEEAGPLNDEQKNFLAKIKKNHKNAVTLLSAANERMLEKLRAQGGAEFNG